MDGATPTFHDTLTAGLEELRADQTGPALAVGILMREQATALVRRALGAIPNPREVAFDYDRDSDILLIHFTSEPRPSTAIQIDDPTDDVYVLLNRGTDQVVGLQIDGFLTEFIHRHPDLADILAVAHLSGITREEAIAAANQARQQEPQVAVVTHFLERLIA